MIVHFCAISVQHSLVYSLFGYCSVIEKEISCWTVVRQLKEVTQYRKFPCNSFGFKTRLFEQCIYLATIPMTLTQCTITLNASLFLIVCTTLLSCICVKKKEIINIKRLGISFHIVYFIYCKIVTAFQAAQNILQSHTSHFIDTFFYHRIQWENTIHVHSFAQFSHDFSTDMSLNSSRAWLLNIFFLCWKSIATFFVIVDIRLH